MKKRFIAALLTITSTLLATGDITGFWKSIDENTGNPRCVVAVYEYEGLCYGRIIGTFDDEGKMKETIYKPVERAPGLNGNPYYCGLDLIWYLQDNGNRYEGKIADPEKGKIYNAELWTEGDNLIVRGKLLFFGRSQTWLPAEAADFPKGFKMPKTEEFVPVIPQPD
jgi:uncharacterized protein (DUF2147 family)